jgi:rod shape determining protein RodA
VSKLKTIDIAIFIIPIVFLAVSIAIIYSLVMGTNNESLWSKQAMVGLVGIVAMVGVCFVDYRQFRGVSAILYIISILLLIIVEFVGKTVNGAMNWIDLGFFQLQPSEVAKVFLIIVLASFFSRKIGKISWSDIFTSFLIVALPLILILLEPDFGTGLIVILMYLTMLIMSKPTRAQILTLVLTVVVVLSIGFGAYMKVKPFDRMLRDYQRHRIAVFLDPSLAPTKEGYNVKQAQITVGSGGMFGRGLGKGSQSQLRFLPESHTDFIFSGIAESFGFLGSGFFLFLYCFFLYRLIQIGQSARDNFGLLIVVGAVSMFFYQVLISVGMNIGLLPVTGIPLPLMSYGGTSLFVSLFVIGLVQSIHIHRQRKSF